MRETVYLLTMSVTVLLLSSLVMYLEYRQKEDS